MAAEDWSSKTRNIALVKLTEQWRDLGLSAPALSLLGALSSYSSTKNHIVWPSLRALATESLPKSTCQDALNELEQAQCIWKVPKGYDLTPMLSLAVRASHVGDFRRAGFQNRPAYACWLADDWYVLGEDHHQKVLDRIEGRKRCSLDHDAIITELEEMNGKSYEQFLKDTHFMKHRKPRGPAREGGGDASRQGTPSHGFATREAAEPAEDSREEPDEESQDEQCVALSPEGGPSL